MASHADVIVEVVPEVAKRASQPDQPRAINDPDSARFRLHDAFARFLRETADDNPLILILDDRHWADDASLRLLEFVAQELAESQILVLGTYRDSEVTREHPLFHTLGDLSRRRLFSRIAMGGLNAEGVEAMLAAQSENSFPPNISNAIHKQTDGNPLFVGEMIRYLDQENLLNGNDLIDLNSLQIDLPEGIREVIGRRLSNLSVQANDVLTNAAFLVVNSFWPWCKNFLQMHQMLTRAKSSTFSTMPLTPD